MLNRDQTKTLQAQYPLAGLEYTRGCGTKLHAVSGFTLTSLAASDDEPARIEKSLGIAPAAIGQAVSSDHGWVLRLSPEQCLLFSAKGGVAPTLQQGAGVYATDQSDGWVAVQLRGPAAHPTLDLLTMVDTRAATFVSGGFARTTIEHLNAVVWKQGDDDFCLLSASSSALSFWHAVETALRSCNSDLSPK